MILSAALVFSGTLLVSSAQRTSGFQIPPDPVFVAIAKKNLCCVSGLQRSSQDLLLIGILDRKEPPDDAPAHDDEDAESYFYATTYFHRGAHFKLFHGGAALAEAVIKGTAGFQCDSRVGTAVLTSGARQQSLDYSIATNGSQIKTHPNHQRPVTQTEKEEALQVVRNIYLGQGVTESALSKIEVRNLIQTEVDHSGERVLIGTFFVASKEADYELFAVLAGAAGQLRAQFIRYNRVADVEDQKDSEEETFVDQLDLDGDGTDELVTEVSYYEAEDFRILKRFGTQWREVHKGGSGGC